MSMIYMCKDTRDGIPLQITASENQICVITEEPYTRKSSVVILSAEEGMKLAFAIAEHFSGEEA